MLEGGVQREGNRLRVTVQLIDAASGYHVWSNRFDCSAGDIFAVEDETVRGVVAALRVRMREGMEARVTRARTASPDAHDLYLRGRHLSASRNPGALHQAAQHFERAIEADPAYAAAHAALAECHAVSAFAGFGRPAEWFPRASAEAKRALALDPTCRRDARAVLGHGRGTFEWQWGQAEAHFRRALELNPGHAWRASGIRTCSQLPDGSTKQSPTRSARASTTRCRRRSRRRSAWRCGYAGEFERADDRI